MVAEPLRFRPTATFLAPRAVPVLSLWRNRLTPEVAVGTGEVLIRLLARRRLPVAGIETVTVDLGLGQRVLVVPRAGWFIYGANFPTREGAQNLVAALAHAGAPLDEAARALLGADGV